MTAITSPGEARTLSPHTGRSAPPWLRRLAPRLLDAYAAGVLLILFLPIFVIVLFSFNDPIGKFNFVWKGFSLEAWQDPFKYPALVEAMVLSLKVALISTVISAALGTLIAVALVRYRFRGNSSINTFLVLPLTTPEVVLGASLLTLFLDLDWATGFGTIIVAHVMFQISFVALTVKARVRGFDWSLEDAAMDLGANPYRTFWRVTFPLILPGIIAAAMLSFALSLDDFIITVFNSGNEVTYPLYVNNAAKTALPPQINVMATIILLGSLVTIAATALYSRWRTRGEQ